MTQRFRCLRGDQINPDLWQAKRVAVRRFLPERARRSAGPVTQSYLVKPGDPNVVGIGIGRKWTEGKGTPHYAVRVYVRTKIASSRLGSKGIPGELDGIPTDVIETGTFRALASTIALARQRTRPLGPGISVGFASGTQFVAGTITAIVERGGDRFALSNNHVLAFENQLAIGSDIIQPASIDGGHDTQDRIGTLAEFVPLDPDSNELDAALARIDAGIDANEAFPRRIKLDSVQPIAAAVQARVAKFGRGTGFTEGTVEDLGIDAQVDFESGQFTFVDQILIQGTGKPFSDVGDSGAMVVSVGAATRPVAMLFAGSPNHSLATPIDRVLTKLGVGIMT